MEEEARAPTAVPASITPPNASNSSNHPAYPATRVGLCAIRFFRIACRREGSTTGMAARCSTAPHQTTSDAMNYHGVRIGICLTDVV